MKQFNMTTFFNLLQEFGINERVLIKYQELTMEAKIGEGAYGEVFLGKWLGQNVAIKVLLLTYHFVLSHMGREEHPGN
jgi:predicted Ser/Thr protein kinase